jgi:hypothetical protein
MFRNSDLGFSITLSPINGATTTISIKKSLKKSLKRRWSRISYPRISADLISAAIRVKKGSSEPK